MSVRSFKYVKYDSGSTDETEVLNLNPGGASGHYSVYARRIGGAGTATLTVSGSFKSAPSANDKFEVQAATSVGTGSLTNILGASEEDQFPYLVLALDRTGTCEVDVYVTLM